MPKRHLIGNDNMPKRFSWVVHRILKYVPEAVVDSAWNYKICSRGPWG